MTNGDNKQPGMETATATVPQRRTVSLPSWLDGRTIAVLTGLVSIAAMVQTSHSRLSDDIHRLRDDMYEMRTELRQELRGDIAGVRQELRGDIAGVRKELSGDIAGVRQELRGGIAGLRQEVRGGLAGLRHELTAKIDKLDDRLRVVEIDVAAIRTHLIGLDARPHDDEPQHEPS